MQRYCVYNTTRETFLSLGVRAADTGFSRLKGLIGKLKLSFDDGLWVVPSRGIHTIGVLFPLDLVYLDNDFRVIHVVESFPSFHVAPLLAQAASVLELPTHTIYPSQTQIGDQLLICVADQMEEQLTDQLSPQAPATVEAGISERAPEPAGVMSRMLSWLKLWLRNNRRQSDRQLAPGLSAYFWNGAAPERHEIRDISPTGLYLVTKERWFPGTIVKVTLQAPDSDKGVTRTIAVQSQAVRQGVDGVGLAFMLPEKNNSGSPENTLHREADKKSLEDFLKRLMPPKEERS